MYKILHVKLTAGEIFLNDIKPFNLKWGSLGGNTLLNEQIISKRLVLNALLNLIGETPISNRNTNNILSKIRNNEIEGISYESPWINLLRNCIESSYFKLNEDNIFRLDKNGNRQYKINQRQGLWPMYAGDKGQRKAGDIVKDITVSGYISWDRLYQCFLDNDYFIEWCNDLKNILNYDPETKPLKKVISDLMESNENQVEQLKIMVEKFNKKRAYTNVLNLMEAILYKCGHCDAYNPILFQRGKYELKEKIKIKYSISVEGELYIVLPEEIIEYIETHYVPTRMFDGGMFIIENVFDTMDKNITEIMNEGFKPMSELTL